MSQLFQEYPVVAAVAAVVTVVLGPAGAVWMTFKVKLNGMVERLDRIAQAHDERIGQIANRHEKFAAECTNTMKEIGDAVHENRRAIAVLMDRTERGA